MNLTGQDHRTVLLAVSIAIAHESAILQRLQADEEFRRLTESIEQRRQQLEMFQKLLDKLAPAAAARA